MLADGLTKALVPPLALVSFMSGRRYKVPPGKTKQPLRLALIAAQLQHARSGESPSNPCPDDTCSLSRAVVLAAAAQQPYVPEDREDSFPSAVVCLMIGVFVLGLTLGSAFFSAFSLKDAEGQELMRAT